MSNKAKHLGTALILLSVVVFLVLSIPFILSRIPGRIIPVPKTGYFITIPKIQAVSPIIVGVDPWNKTEYNLALSRGIAQAKNTSLPGESRLVYLFAHSSGLPWEILDKNIPFLRLDELQPSDQILLYRNGKEYAYSVFEKKVVAATETKFLTHTGENVLILQTCWPLGTDWKRLLVFAVPASQNE